MKKSRFPEEKIIYCLKQAEAGAVVKDLCRQLGVSEATFYNWKKKYGDLSVTEAKRLRTIEDENNRLKRLVAELTLDKHILRKSSKKSSETRCETFHHDLDRRSLRSESASFHGSTQDVSIHNVLQKAKAGSKRFPQGKNT